LIDKQRATVFHQRVELKVPVIEVFAQQEITAAAATPNALENHKNVVYVRPLAAWQSGPWSVAAAVESNLVNNAYGYQNQNGRWVPGRQRPHIDHVFMIFERVAVVVLIDKQRATVFHQRVELKGG
jgi:hypothetical protein